MHNQQQSELLENLGGEALAGSGFEMETATRLDDVSLDSPTEAGEEDAQ